MKVALTVKPVSGFFLLHSLWLFAKRFSQRRDRPWDQTSKATVHATTLRAPLKGNLRLLGPKFVQSCYVECRQETVQESGTIGRGLGKEQGKSNDQDCGRSDGRTNNEVGSRGRGLLIWIAKGQRDRKTQQVSLLLLNWTHDLLLLQSSSSKRVTRCTLCYSGAKQGLFIGCPVLGKTLCTDRLGLWGSL